jgi:trigger factor
MNMNIPGAAGAADNPEMWERAQEESDKLLDELKEAVQADLEDIGVLRKQMRVTVPAKIIADHMEKNYSDLMHDALVPGFRKGRAPRRLIEKRFGADVRESLTTSIVGQSFYAAAENNELEILGDPLFRIEADAGVQLMDIGEALQHLKLPESGDFGYTCEVELKPTFEVPALEGIEVKTPEIAITDEMVEEQILRQRKIRGRLEPVSDAAQKDDQCICDVVLTVDGAEIKRDENALVGVRPTVVEGIPLTDLDKTLAGTKAGETRTVKCSLPPDYERADLRGKDGEIAITLHEIKRLAPEPLDAFVQTMGFDSEEELREDVRAQLDMEREQMLGRAKKAQVEEYLLESTELDLPQGFSSRQTERAVHRRVIDLQQRGMPMSDIESHIDELRTSASEQVVRDLKLGFILEKVAEKLDIHVTDEEVNTEIARIARMYGRRFDRVRDDLQGAGLLEQLVEQIRQDKCVAKLLETAKFVAADADNSKGEAASKKPAAKKTAKKATAKRTAAKKTATKKKDSE